MKPNRFNATSSQEQFLQAKQEAETAALAATNESDIDDLGDDVTELQQQIAGLGGAQVYQFTAQAGDTVNLPALTGKHLCFLLGQYGSNFEWQMSYGDETSMPFVGAPEPASIGYFSNINTIDVTGFSDVFWVVRIPCKSQNV